MTKTLLKNLLLLLQFLIYLQSAGAEKDGENNLLITNNVSLTGNQNNLSIHCSSSNFCPSFSSCLNNCCQCLHGSLLINKNKSLTCLPPPTFLTTSSFTTTVHIESIQIVQTVLLIIFPLTALFFLFFFCDRLGKYVQQMQEEVSSSEEIHVSRSDGVFTNLSEAQNLGQQNNTNENVCINISNLKNNIADLPPSYSVVEQLESFSHVQYLTNCNK